MGHIVALLNPRKGIPLEEGLRQGLAQDEREELELKPRKGIPLEEGLRLIFFAPKGAIVVYPRKGIPLEEGLRLVVKPI